MAGHVAQVSISGLKQFGIPGKPDQFQLGPRTLIVGGNEAGKDALIAAITLATTGKALNVAGRSAISSVSMVRELLGRTDCPLEVEASIQGEGGTVETARWNGGSAKGADIATLLYQDAREALGGSAEKASAWILKGASIQLPAITDADVGVAWKEATTRLDARSELPLGTLVPAVLRWAEGEMRDAKKAAENALESANRLSAGLQPRPLPEELVAALAPPTLGRPEDLAVAYQAASAGREAALAQGLEAAAALELPGVPRPAGDAEMYRVAEQASILGAPYGLCICCGGGPPASSWVEGIRSQGALLVEAAGRYAADVAERTRLSHVVDEAVARVEAHQTTLAQIEADYPTAEAQWQQFASARSLPDLMQLQAQWGRVDGVREVEAQHRARWTRMSKLVDWLHTVAETAVKAGMVDFIRRAQEAMPSRKLGLEIEGNGVSVGILDGDGRILQGLTGMQEVLVYSALGAAAQRPSAGAPSPRNKIGIVIPDDRAIQPERLSELLQGLTRCAADQVIVPSIVWPSSPIPDGWTVVDLGGAQGVRPPGGRVGFTERNGVVLAPVPSQISSAAVGVPVNTFPVFPSIFPPVSAVPVAEPAAAVGRLQQLAGEVRTPAAFGGGFAGGFPGVPVVFPTASPPVTLPAAPVPLPVAPTVDVAPAAAPVFVTPPVFVAPLAAAPVPVPSASVASVAVPVAPVVPVAAALSGAEAKVAKAFQDLLVPALTAAGGELSRDAVAALVKQADPEAQRVRDARMVKLLGDVAVLVDDVVRFPGFVPTVPVAATPPVSPSVRSVPVVSAPVSVPAIPDTATPFQRALVQAVAAGGGKILRSQANQIVMQFHPEYQKCRAHRLLELAGGLVQVTEDQKDVIFGTGSPVVTAVATSVVTEVATSSVVPVAVSQPDSNAEGTGGDSEDEAFAAELRAVIQPVVPPVTPAALAAPVAPVTAAPTEVDFSNQEAQGQALRIGRLGWSEEDRRVLAKNPETWLRVYTERIQRTSAVITPMGKIVIKQNPVSGEVEMEAAAATVTEAPPAVVSDADARKAAAIQRLRAVIGVS